MCQHQQQHQKRKERKHQNQYQNQQRKKGESCDYSNNNITFRTATTQKLCLFSENMILEKNKKSNSEEVFLDLKLRTKKTQGIIHVIVHLLKIESSSKQIDSTI